MLLLAFTLALSAAPAWARGSSEPASPSTLAVAGEGIAHRTPDTASLRLGVETEHPRAETAVQDNANRMQTLFQSLAQLGIAEDQIKTVGYNVSVQRPQRTTQNEEPGEPYYRVTNSLQVSLTDTELVGAVIDASFAAGATFVRNISFGISSTAEAELEALELAMQHARSKAERMAQSQGAEIGKVLNMYEEYGGGMPRQEADMMMYARSSEPTPIAAGDYSVTARVQITYELQYRE